MPSQSTNGTDPSGVARASMLRMARTWQSLGQINQAIGVYARLLERYPASSEARAAGEEILELAQSYEQRGHYHLALGLYDKLERLG